MECAQGNRCVLLAWIRGWSRVFNCVLWNLMQYVRVCPERTQQASVGSMYSLCSWDSWGALQSLCNACAETSQVRQGLGTGSGRIRLRNVLQLAALHRSVSGEW